MGRLTSVYEDPNGVNYLTSYTPAVYHYYDSATNGRGRLYWEQAAGVSANVFDAYDALGRPTQYHHGAGVSATLIPNDQSNGCKVGYKTRRADDAIRSSRS